MLDSLVFSNIPRLASKVSIVTFTWVGTKKGDEGRKIRILQVENLSCLCTQSGKSSATFF
jgi:hypothetical protein